MTVEVVIYIMLVLIQIQLFIIAWVLWVQTRAAKEIGSLIRQMISVIGKLLTSNNGQ